MSICNKYSARTYRSEWKLHALPPPALSCALDFTCISLPIHCTCIYLPIHCTCIYFLIHCTCYTVNSCIAQTVTHNNYALYCFSLLLCVLCMHKFQFSSSLYISADIQGCKHLPFLGIPIYYLSLVNLIKLHWNDLLVIDHRFSLIH